MPRAADRPRPLNAMSYELSQDGSLGKNLVRIFRGQIDGALALARGETKPGDTLVHDIRKHLKKARSVLCLLRKQIGRKSLRRADGRLRNIGRLVTEIRDAEVRLETMRQFEQATHHYRSYQKIERLLTAELENFVAGCDGWEGEAVHLLEEVRRQTKSWSTAGYRWRQLRDGLRKTYRSGRKALAKARSKPSVERIHKLRKQTKLLGYQVRLLRPWNNVLVNGLLEQLTQLGELLGRVHDFVLLADRLALERAESRWGKQDDELLALIERNQAELQQRGLELAACFFAPRPAAFDESLENGLLAEAQYKRGFRRRRISSGVAKLARYA